MTIPASPKPATSTRPWQDLVAYSEKFYGTTLRDLFAEQPGRAGDMTFTAGPLRVDFSKHLVDDQILRLLSDLAHDMRLEDFRSAMFDGDKVNATEKRAALHTALRLPVDQDYQLGRQDVAADVHSVLGRMRDFARDLRKGNWQGITGHTIKNVVNIGIGGSDLGPSMAAAALRPYQTAGITPYFVSNLDPADVEATIENLDPESTLFVVSSKTFSTQETLVNANVAKRWLLRNLKDLDVDVEGNENEITRKHFVAVSADKEAVEEFGIDPANMFELWDWVGGRYSVDSAVGLSLMAAIGPRDFMRFLEGFYEVDDHFRTEPLEMNVPVLMGLLNVWYQDFLGAQSHAVLPYSEDLREFPAYLQQLMMESLGKSVRLDGTPVDVPTGAVYWGAPGTNGQHAFYQLFHQGTQLVPADFIGFINPHSDATAEDGETSMHDMLMANFFAQTRVLAFGRTAEEIREDGANASLVPHKVMPGNRPSTTILADKLTPKVLGALIALYEHMTFVQAVIWNINPFDQWGVEYGKQQASELLPAVCGTKVSDAGDSSTDALISFYRQRRNDG